MNLANLASHTVDLDRLPEVPIVLDVGCRWFDFAKEIMRLRPQARIVALDPGPDVEQPTELKPATHDLGPMCNPGITFFKAALVAGDQREMEYEDFYTGIGNFLRENASPYLHQLAEGYTAKGEGRRIRVDCININDLLSLCIGQGLFSPVREMTVGRKALLDLVKFDCEASEFSILENWPGPIATQISVEFHDYTHRTLWNEEYFAKLIGRLEGFGYVTVQHEDHWVGGGQGHWDSLFVLAS